jgi:hypothetical protein
MKKAVLVFMTTALLALDASPAMAEHGGCHREDCGGPPSGAPPVLWEQNCVTDWWWDEEYQGWWAYDEGPSSFGCQPSPGLWRWYVHYP